jgi:hypothetical protein
VLFRSRGFRYVRLPQGTFYGSGGAGKAGACMLNPGFNGVGVTVAMNAQQFESESRRPVFRAPAPCVPAHHADPTAPLAPPAPSHDAPSCVQCVACV